MRILNAVTTRYLTALLVLVAVAPLGAQTGVASAPGRIVGRVVDAVTGQGISDVSVRIDGATIGTMSGVDGRFTIANAPAGAVTIIARRLGYQAKTVTGLQVSAGQTVEQNISLATATRQLETQVVTASAERGTVAEALDMQRNALGIVNAITAEQIARSPDANAAQAIQRVSGVTIQDNKYVFVRGLGERYTTTSLNGARVPSPETDRKVVPLDIFPAGLLQTVTTSKTFTPDQSGDFAGASVNIETREFPAERVTTYSASVGYNSLVTGRGILMPPTSGSEWLGFAGSQRSLSSMVTGFGDNFNSATRPELNQVVRSFRPVWSPVSQTVAPNSSLSVATGGSAGIGSQSVGYLFSGTYSLNNEARIDEVRARAVPSSQGTGGQEPFNLAMNNLYSHSADNEARADSGLLQGGVDLPARRQTLSFIERTVRSNQLKLRRGFGRQTVDLALTSSGTTRSEPDRSSFVQVRYEDPSAPGAFFPYRWFAGSDEGAKRSFSNLDERSLAAALDWTLGFGNPASNALLKVGGAYRHVTRDVENRIYSIRGGALSPSDLELAPELIFDGRFALDTSTLLTPVNNTQTGFYSARDGLAAGYAMMEVPIGDRVRLVGGARLEQWSLHLEQSLLNSSDPQTPDRRDTDVLPSLALNLKITESQSLRLSAAQTLSRPEYREVSRTLYCEMIGEPCTIGNDSLQRALIQNYDVRWEMYPAADEIISVGVFAKRFSRPIERIEIATSGASNYSFVNTTAATNIGAELEVRKRLGWLGEPLDPFLAFTNLTVMQSRIQVGNEEISALTSTDRAMTGQASYVVNAGLSYAPSGARYSASVLYNVIGRRITAVGSKPVADTYEEPRHLLDFSLQLPASRGMLFKLNAKNLLDAPVRQTSGEVTRLEYRTGRILQAGFSWQTGGAP